MWQEFTGIVDAGQDGEGFIARCLERPGAHGQGRTADEAMRRLAERLALTLAVRGGDGLAPHAHRKAPTVH